MNKREFLVAGGAVPLMLAGCGGSTGSAPVRLLNASVGYSELGFMVESTQATTADVAYGAVSPFEHVEAGSVDVTLTQNGSAIASATTRTIGKDTRYTLVAYGKENELSSLLITESTTTPDTGKANVNVLNTSTDIGAVDVYMSTSLDTPYVNEIGSDRAGLTQSGFVAMVPGDYYITVVGTGSVAKGVSDVRFQSAVTYTLADQQIYTIVLTPGVSGVLANVIVLEQNSGGTATSYENSTARARVVTAAGTNTVAVAGTTTTDGVAAPVILLDATSTYSYSDYFVVDTGTAPVVTVNGAAITVVDDTGATAALVAGGDYTIMVYTDSTGTVVAQAIEDDNTAPVSSAGAKFRLINLTANNQATSLSMTVNSLGIATNIPFATASDYTEITPPQTVASTVEVFAGSTQLITRSQVMTLGNIFTEIVVNYDASAVNASSDFFRAATSTAST